MDAILARNAVGRLAFVHERVDIEPVHYVYGEGVLYARTSPGAKLTTLRHNQWVAFEVDEVEGVLDWKSVVIQGSIYPVEDGETEETHAPYARALARIRELVPEALRDDDPTPDRTHLFRLHIQSITGRASESRYR